MESPNFTYNFIEIDPYDYNGILGPNSYGISTNVESVNSSVSIIAKIVLAITYTLVMVICGVGNLLLCCVVLRFRRMRTTTNILIGNLALSDFFVAILCVPFNFYYYMTDSWPFGKPMCVIVGYLKMTSFYVSVNSLLAIAVDR